MTTSLGSTADMSPSSNLIGESVARCQVRFATLQLGESVELLGEPLRIVGWSDIHALVGVQAVLFGKLARARPRLIEEERE
jgi:hypothetical protein